MIDLDLLLTILYTSLPIFFSLICLFYAFYFLKNARSLEDNPESKIRSAAQGYVELIGMVKPLLSNQPILGQLSRKPCAWYSYQIQELTTIRTGNGTQFNWNLIEQGASFEPFLVVDETGECVVLPKGAEIIPSYPISWQGHTRIPKPPSNSFWAWFLWDRWGRYRYTEHLLALDKPVFISGRFITINAEDSKLQEYPSLQFYFKEKNLTSIHILMKEGLSSHENFTISATAEKRLIRTLKWRAFIFFIASVFFMSLSFYSSYPSLKVMLKPRPKPSFSYPLS